VSGAGDTGDGSAGAGVADGPPKYGETWVYESIVGAVPGVDLAPRTAVAIQLLGFEAALLALAAAYDLWEAVPAGTAAIAVAGVGSAVMLRMGTLARRAAVPAPYRHLLFGSSVEVVLSVLAFVALVTYLFVVDPGRGAPAFVERHLGPEPPAAAAYLTLLIAWDLCYRIGTSWWAAVVGLWRSVRFRFDPATAATLRKLDRLNAGFGFVQLGLLPFVFDRPVLLATLGGHVIAVTVVSAVAFGLVRGE